MEHISGIDRNQIKMMALEEMIPENSFATSTDLFTDLLALKDLCFKHS